MMIGVVSDIHSNWEALEVVFGFLEEKGVKEILCCGDVVGYGPDPERCIELLARKRIKTVAGNHDWAVLNKTSVREFNPLAIAAVRWTQERLNSGHRAFLNSLSLWFDISEGSAAGCKVVHAGPAQPEKWGYIFTLEDAGQEFGAFTQEICFIGHTHIPFIIELSDEETRLVPKTKLLNSVPFHLGKDARYLINVGSVGQPRDGDPRACCVLIDLEERWVSFHRLSYDFTTTQRKMGAYGLPEPLVQRLALGQ